MKVHSKSIDFKLVIRTKKVPITLREKVIHSCVLIINDGGMKEGYASK